MPGICVLSARAEQRVLFVPFMPLGVSKIKNSCCPADVNRADEDRRLPWIMSSEARGGSGLFGNGNYEARRLLPPVVSGIKTGWCLPASSAASGDPQTGLAGVAKIKFSTGGANGFRHQPIVCICFVNLLALRTLSFVDSECLLSC